VSYPFHLSGVQVWDPALTVGKLFLAQADGIAGILDVPSGLTPLRDGTCAVDPERFPGFAAELGRRYFASQHPVLLALAHGVLIVCFVILRRGGATLPPVLSAELPADFLADADRMDAVMAR
jgi:hypothetical protein